MTKRFSFSQLVLLVAAAALMAEDGNPARPRSLTLIGGPVDARIAPTREEALARLLPRRTPDRHAAPPARPPRAARRPMTPNDE